MKDWTDASNLKFSLQLVVLVVSTALTVGGAVWTVTAQIRSDLRDIKTQMDERSKAAAQLKEAEDRASRAEANAIQIRIDTLERKVQQTFDAHELLRLEFTAHDRREQSQNKGG